ncbi:MAG: zinc metallopeptidase [Planctomycetota bacterium]
MFFDPRYLIFVGPFVIIALLAKLWVDSAFARWSRHPASSRLSGAQVAQAVLAHAGVHDVRIEQSQGYLSDHYDPRERVLRLSPPVFQGASVAASAIAAHEAGHAMQHSVAYAPLQLRSFYVPIAQFGSMLFLPLFIAGLLLSIKPLALAGLVLFGAAVVFQLITLPVEFDASRRAKRVLADTGLITDAEEAAGVSSVLTAAAMTYVAATLQSIATLLYYLSVFNRSSRD